MSFFDPLTYGIPINAKFVADRDGEVWLILDSWEPRHDGIPRRAELVTLHEGKLIRLREMSAKYRATPEVEFAHLPNPGVEMGSTQVLLFLLARRLDILADKIGRPWRM